MIARVFHAAFAEIEIEHGEEFSARSGIGDERFAAGIGDHGGLRHGVMGMAAENDVDAGNAAGKLEIDVHAVMRQQEDGIDLVLLAQSVNDFLQLRVADAECPIGREALGMGDRHIGHGLADDADATAVHFLDRCRLEDAAGCGIESRRVVEGGLVGQEHVLRQKLAFEPVEILAQNFLAIGKLPMAGHHIDAEEVADFDHVRALHGVGKSAALPQIAAVQ